MVKLQELLDYTQQLLAVERYRDYAPNGLQVEGKGEVRRIVSGVTASLALLEAAVDLKADAVLVHHGYFWKSEPAGIVGMKQRRIKLLLQHDINLLAYHLPLDAHPELGNNAQLAYLLDAEIDNWFGEQNLVAEGNLRKPVTLAELAHRVGEALGRPALPLGDPAKTVARVAWCSGGAQGMHYEAALRGVDAYISGEVSEQNAHIAAETGVAYLAAGHHATEKFGVQALGAHLAAQFGLDHRFIDIANPV